MSSAPEAGPSGHLPEPTPRERWPAAELVALAQAIAAICAAVTALLTIVLTLVVKFA